jgi:ATP-dependent DNA helicase RecG
VLRVVGVQSASKAEISALLGQKEVSGQLNKVVRALLSSKLMAYTIPDKPNSRLQKYQLTDAGRQQLARGNK